MRRVAREASVVLTTAAGVGLSALLWLGCPARDGDAGTRPTATPQRVRDSDDQLAKAAAVKSVHTDLSVGACTKGVDASDPNETPYLLCPGVAGYSLIVRRAEAGRHSIDLVDAARRVFPLDFTEVVTRHMSSVEGRAEWRVATRGNERVPIALIVRVQVHEDDDRPESVTSSWLVVAKIGPAAACVTDRIRDGSRSLDEVRTVADSAGGRPCAPAVPPLAAGTGRP